MKNLMRRCRHVPELRRRPSDTFAQPVVNPVHDRGGLGPVASCPMRLLPRRTWSKVVAVVAAVAVSAIGVSVTRYVLANPGEPVQQSVAAWARNAGLGPVVDRLEAWFHDDPPSTEAAGELALQTPDTTAAPMTTTTVPPPWAPQRIEPVVTPPLKGEGRWRPVLDVDGEARIWATSLRPLPDYASVVATAAVWDRAGVHAALYHGDEIPGGGPWQNWRRVRGDAKPALLAAFNGGFRFEHKAGGYVAEGRTVRPLVEGYATFAIAGDGTATVGVLGEDVADDGSWASLRQNLPPLVRGGVSVYRNYGKVDWGKDYGNKIYTFRSAVCTRTDGSMLYVAVGDVNIEMLVRTVLAFGCDTAMQLDINGNWPLFSVFSGLGTSGREGTAIDKRMGNRNRYLNGAPKDFFALFEPTLLPPGAVK